MKKAILIYIALRSLIAVFYDVNVLGNLNALELSGFIFPVSLCIYWFQNRTSHYDHWLTIFFFIIIIWVMFSTFSVLMRYGFYGINDFSQFIRILNGFAVFVVFPKIFKEKRDIESLVNAFLFATIFPLLQGLAQVFIGPEFAGMSTSIIRGDQSEFTMYYGLYYKYDGYAQATLFGGLAMIYKIGNSVLLKNNKKLILDIITLCAFYFLLTLTLSRTLLINMSIILFVLIFTYARKYMPLFIMLSVSTSIVLTSSFIQDRAEQLQARSESEYVMVSERQNIDAGLHGRVGKWRNSLDRFSREPFLAQFIGTHINIGPHGDYITWLLSYGYIGVLFYITFFVLLLFSLIRTVYFFREKGVILFVNYSIMCITSTLVWLVGAIIYNPSQYPDFMYFILGNAAIALSMKKRYENSNHLFRPGTSPLHGPQHRYRDHPQIETLI